MQACWEHNGGRLKKFFQTAFLFLCRLACKRFPNYAKTLKNAENTWEFGYNPQVIFPLGNTFSPRGFSSNTASLHQQEKNRL
ncbi:hypothetical protein BV913_03275 [Neisseria dumasiana]|uniref:Uncharacterized protein n=1 Tax=Neisseria dumasiana TaxID=1931275 RepID=A0ABX3WMK3_9NEIS|nr:hypothetical protein BV913_03275 [Neisseria dumasiana]